MTAYSHEESCCRHTLQRERAEEEDVLRLAFDANGCRATTDRRRESRRHRRARETETPTAPTGQIHWNNRHIFLYSWFKFDAPEFLSNQNIRRLTDSQLAWANAANPARLVAVWKASK